MLPHREVSHDGAVRDLPALHRYVVFSRSHRRQQPAAAPLHEADGSEPPNAAACQTAVHGKIGAMKPRMVDGGVRDSLDRA